LQAFVVHEHLNHYYKPNPNSRLHVLFKPKHNVTNSVTYLGCKAFSVCHFWTSSGCYFLYYLCIWPYSKFYYFSKKLGFWGFTTFSQLATQQTIHHLYIFWVLFNYLLQFLLESLKVMSRGLYVSEFIFMTLVILWNIWSSFCSWYQNLRFYNFNQ